MPATMALSVQAPTTTERTCGLLGAATVRRGVDGHFLGGVEWVPEAGCAMPDEQGVTCIDGPQAEKQFDGYDVITASAFVLVKGQKCKPIFGDTREVAAGQARSGLDMGECTGVEQHFARQVLHQASDLGVGVSRAQTVLGEVEAYLWANYGPRGVIHVDPVTAAHLSDSGLLRCDAMGTTTCNGTPVSVGAYPREAGLHDDQSYIYGTGAVLVLVGDSITIDTENRATNEVLVLAERPYVVGVECVNVKAKTTTPGTKAVPDPTTITGVTVPTAQNLEVTVTPTGAVPPRDLPSLIKDPVVGCSGSAKPSAAWPVGAYLTLASGTVHWDNTAGCWAPGPVPPATAKATPGNPGHSSSTTRDGLPPGTVLPTTTTGTTTGTGTGTGTPPGGQADACQDGWTLNLGGDPAATATAGTLVIKQAT